MNADRMAALHRNCFTHPRPWSALEFKATLADPLSLVVTASQGFLIGRVVADEAELLSLAVDPAARRAGHAHRLLVSFHEVAHMRGATEVFLEVAADNHAAIALYRSAGYVAAGLRRGYYSTAKGADIDALLLRKPLSAA